MRYNKYSGPAGTGPNDVVALPTNPKRRALVITYGGSGNLFVGFDNPTQSGTVYDLILQAAAGPLILPPQVIGDSLQGQVRVWSSTGSQPCTVGEWFDD